MGRAQVVATGDTGWIETGGEEGRQRKMAEEDTVIICGSTMFEKMKEQTDKKSARHGRNTDWCVFNYTNHLYL